MLDGGRNTRIVVGLLGALVGWTGGCNTGSTGGGGFVPPPPDTGDHTDGTDAGTSTGNPDPTTTGQGSTSGDPGTTGTPDPDDCESFVCPPDVGDDFKTCDVWTQDCLDGEKCMPWANDGGNSWNALKCVPVDPNPKQPGDPCTVEGSGVSGLDDCDVGAMCWDVDIETGMGVCISLCGGSEASPTCPDSQTECAIYNDGVLPLCLALCDPLVQDCATEDLCISNPDGQGFVCVLDASGTEGAYGDPCEYANACDPGNFCADAATVPGCQGSLGCCSPFCDLSDPNATCPGEAGGQECTAWYEPGTEPPGYENVGACVIPA